MEIGPESDIVEKWLKVCMIEDEAAVVVVASYRSISRKPVRFKALAVTSDVLFRSESKGSGFHANKRT